MNNIKSHFPIFKSHPDLVYLDSGATALKPQSVIDSLNDYYANYSSNIHRGLYDIAEKATELFEESRKKIAHFMNVSAEEIIFTKNATEGFNLLASCLGDTISSTDVIGATILDHHSNFVPWQVIAKKHKATFFVLQSIEDKIPSHIKIFSLPIISNVTGELVDVRKIVLRIREHNPHALIVLDACQSVTTIPMKEFTEIADCIVFSGHKMYGPTGVGVVYCRKNLLSSFSPYQTGGGMISKVTTTETTYDEIPAKFEAGTPPIAEVIALQKAVEFVQDLQKNNAYEYIHSLAVLAKKRLEEEFGKKIHIISPVFSDSKSQTIVSFYMDDIHAHDIAQMLGDEGICVRAGHHCAMPLHEKLCIAASVRVSFGIYNDEKDVEKLVEGMKKIVKTFK